MSIDIYEKYHKQCCPFCRSFNVEKVSLLHEREVENRNKAYRTQEPQRYEGTTGALCENCSRYHSNHKYKWRYDRKAIRRDRDALDRFLKKSKP